MKTKWGLLVTLAALYAVQGIAVGVVLVVLPAWLAEHEASAATIAAIEGVAAVGFSAKVLLGPLVDRYPPRRLWIALGQVVMAAALVAIAFVEPLATTATLAACVGVLALGVGLLDVGVDGLAVGRVGASSLGRANGLMAAGQLVGAACSAALGPLLIGAIGYAQAMLIFAGLVMVSVLLGLALKGPGQASQPVRWGSVIGATFRSLVASRWTVLALGTVAAVDGLTRVLYPVVFVQQHAWTDEQIGSLQAGTTVLGGLVAVGVGLGLVDRFGWRRVLSVGAAVLAIGLLLAATPGPRLVGVGAIAIALGAARVAFTVAYMGLSRTRYAATQFSAFMTTLNLSAALAGGILGLLHPHVPTAALFIGVALVVLACPLLLASARTLPPDEASAAESGA